MSEKTSLDKNRSKSFSEIKNINPKVLSIIPKEMQNPDSHLLKLSESKIKNIQENKKSLIITKLIIQSNQKSQKILPKNSRNSDSLNIEETGPFFKFLSDETIDFSHLSEEEKHRHSENIYKEHLKQTFYSLKIVKNLQKYSSLSLKTELIQLPPKYSNRKTLIFDLDETLVHCMGQRKGQVQITVKFPCNKECKAWINLRPYLIDCLEKAAEYFEVIVFTASHQFYADSVINYIDPENKYFNHRLYRDSCVKYGNFNIKDLRLINRRLQDIVIVDNSVFSFAFQLDNGVPIIPWINDPLDTELLRLIEYFKVIKDVDDVREFNRKLFQLDSLYEDYIEDFPRHSELGK